MEREAPAAVVMGRLIRCWLPPLAGVALLLPLTMETGRAQGEPRLIEPLKTNAVRIEAAWPMGNAQFGFGFIVGERASTQLYIATANHVVRDRDRGRSTTIKVWLRGEGTATVAELLDDSSQALDLAVLRVAKPQGFTWTAQAIGSEGEQRDRGTAVWFIGRDRDWFTPVSPGRMAAITFESKMQLEGLPVRVGSSGAPLVAGSGIIGMLTSDEGDTSYGVPIDNIQKAFAQWDFPFTLTPAGAGSAPPPAASSRSASAPDRQPPPPARQPSPSNRQGAGSAAGSSVGTVGGLRGVRVNDFVTEFAVSVQSTQGWQATGITLTDSDTVKVRYLSGTWRNTGRTPYVSPQDGAPPQQRPGGRGICAVLPSIAITALVGKIGEEGRPFEPLAVIYKGDGMLYLRMNECDPGQIDNDGTINVRIERTRAPG